VLVNLCAVVGINDISGCFLVLEDVSTIV